VSKVKVWVSAIQQPLFGGIKLSPLTSDIIVVKHSTVMLVMMPLWCLLHCYSVQSFKQGEISFRPYGSTALNQSMVHVKNCDEIFQFYILSVS